jgi:RNA-directed DNA polymerase
VEEGISWVYGDMAQAAKARGRGRNVKRLVEEEFRSLLLGWANYFRLAEVKGIFEQLDWWI